MLCVDGKVKTFNFLYFQEYVESPKVLALISSFTALMLQVKQLAEGER